MMADPRQQCKIMVDGTDFHIQEPALFNPKWYSHKFRGPGLRYEIGVCIKTGWIVWVNGPFPAGAWPDQEIAGSVINHHLENNECYVGDGSYYDRGQWVETPTGHNNTEQKMYALVRAHHETVNSCFKLTEICPSRGLDTSKLLVNALDGENSSQQSNKN